MGAVADVTDIVLPKIEEAERKGKKEGIEKVAKGRLLRDFERQERKGKKEGIEKVALC